MQDIFTVLYKEIKYIKYEYKNLMWSVFASIVLPLLIMYKQSKGMPIYMFAVLASILIPILVGGQFAAASIQDERNNKTLELTMSMGLPKWAIVISKLIIPLGLSTIFSIISYLEFKYVILNRMPDIGVNPSTILILGVVGTFYGCCIGFMSTALIYSESTSITVGMLIITSLYSGTMYLTNPLISIHNLLLFLIIALIICTIANAISILAFKS